MQIHEAANIFPMEEDTLQQLADDIKENGQRQPVELLNGKVIDGRRRMAACELIGIAPQFRNITTDDPVAYVLSLNLHRRHLTPSQRAMAGARAREIYDRQAKERQHDGQERGRQKQSGAIVENLPQTDTGKARDQVGKVVGVSGKTIDHATKVIKAAVPEVVKAVDEGRMSVSTAALLSTEPPEVQREEASDPKRRRAYQSVSNKYQPQAKEPEADNQPVKVRGVGVTLANEAINCLIRIPKNDPLRSRGFQIVKDWIKVNSRG